MACLYKKKLWDNRWCPVTCFYCTGEQERTCEHNKATNADRIRAMSDEELAWELMTWRIETEAKHQGVESNYPNTQKTILEWLKQPTEVEK